MNEPITVVPCSGCGARRGGVQLGRDRAAAASDAAVGLTGDDSPAWARQRGIRQFLLSNSLGLVMGLIFLLSWPALSIAGTAAYNEQQNWQSELLAVTSMAILSIYLRQRGSSQSKPVGSPHTATGVQG